MTPSASRNYTWAKLGLAASCISIIPCFLFGVWGPKLNALPGMKKGVLIAIILTAMLTCSEVSCRRYPLLGMLLLPLFFFGLSSLACWWITS